MVKVPIYPPVMALIYGYHIVIGGLTILKNMKVNGKEGLSHI